MPWNYRERLAQAPPSANNQKFRLAEKDRLRPRGRTARNEQITGLFQTKTGFSAIYKNSRQYCALGSSARVSTYDQQTLVMQHRAMRDYAERRVGRSSC